MAVLIIAEAGVNHNGNLDMAKSLALAAKNAGADVVKFQTAIPQLVISRFAQKANYQKTQTCDKELQLEMVKKLHFNFESHEILKNYCDNIGIQYISTAFDLPSIEFLASLNLPFMKIPSGEITNLPYLEKIAKLNKPLMLSTGMSNLPEIEDAISLLENNGAGTIMLMHCNTQYPTPFEDANLLAMQELKDVFGLEVGLSDHTTGIVCPVAATALGAICIEKHFTLDKTLPGPDHKASLSIKELEEMVKAVRNCEKALGSEKKQVTSSEAQNKIIARKSIVACKNIKKGELFTTENITTKRPGDGISPMYWYNVLNKKAVKDFMEDERIAF